MYHEQKATMEKMAAKSKQSKDKLTKRSAAELRQAKDALAGELRQAKEALQSAPAAHAKEVSGLLQQVSETAKALMSSDSVRCNCDKCWGPPASLRSFYCTACGKKTFEVSKVCEHPTLHGVGICIYCYSFLMSSPFTKDIVDNVEEQCRWCGQGGNIIVCGQCDKVFCESCIVRNYGDVHGLGLILKMNDWKCFCCSPALLAVHVDELNAFREAKTREERHFQILSENAKLLSAQERKKRQNRDKGIHTNSHNKIDYRVKSINQASSSKRAVILDNEHTTCQKKPRRSTAVKEHEDIEKQQAPSATTPVKTYIRPPQWAEKRGEIHERRARAAAELLESGITYLPNNAPNHQNSNTQAEPVNQGEEGQLLRREGRLDAEQKLPKESASAQVKPVNAVKAKGKKRVDQFSESCECGQSSRICIRQNSQKQSLAQVHWNI